MFIPHCKSFHRSLQALNNRAFRLLVLLVTLVSIVLVDRGLRIINYRLNRKPVKADKT